MRTAVITGASSGIGAASALALAKDGWAVVLGARRQDRLAEVAAQCGPHARALPLDVTDPASVADFAAKIDRCDLLLNNAGGAKGMRTIADADEAEWEWMFQANVMGTLRVTRALLPTLLDSGDAQILTIASIASHDAYAGGGGYNAAKFAESALIQVLRRELAGLPVRVSEIDPGLVRTEFSLVRFAGDAERADAVYDGITPLTAEDIAETVRWIASLPSRMNIDLIRVVARDQISVMKVPPREKLG